MKTEITREWFDSIDDINKWYLLRTPKIINIESFENGFFVWYHKSVY